MVLRRSLLGVLVLLLVCLAVSVWADMRVTLNNGSTITGTMVEQTNGSLVIKTQGSTKTLKMSDILSMDINPAPSGNALGSLAGQGSSSKLSPETARLLLQRKGLLPYTPMPVPTPTEDILAASLLLGATPTQPLLSPDMPTETPVSSDTPTEATAPLIPSDPGDQDTVYLNGGKKLFGYVLEEREKDVVMRLKHGTITISRSQIQIIERNSNAPKSQ